MFPPSPGFPRRGVPFQKVRLPLEREAPRHLLRTPLGRRLVLYGFGVVVAASMLQSITSDKKRVVAQGDADTRPAAVALTNPPRAFAPPEVLHQLRTIDDFSRSPRPGALGAALAFLSSAEGPESRPAAFDWTWLALDQALAHPTEFRGGLVRIRGTFIGVETFGPHTAIGAEYTYRGYLLAFLDRKPYMVIFETAHPPAEFEKNQELEVEGVFLQAAQYEDKEGRAKVAPFLVTTAARRYEPPPPPRSFFDARFTWIVVVLIILVLVAAFFLLKKARTPDRPDGNAPRPSGPGR